jgi:hypothetical protein
MKAVMGRCCGQPVARTRGAQLQCISNRHAEPQDKPIKQLRTAKTAQRGVEHRAPTPAPSAHLRSILRCNAYPCSCCGSHMLCVVTLPTGRGLGPIALSGSLVRAPLPIGSHQFLPAHLVVPCCSPQAWW